MILPIKKRKFHALFITLCLVLGAYKWQDFQLPYYWDELGVYAQSAGYQYHHAVSLLPASVLPVLSRGHPLMFTFLMSAAMRMIGEGLLPVHLFCFAISVLLLLVVYLKVSQYFSPMAGLLSAVLLAMQAVFVAQSGFVLPEVCLALFIFLALSYYHEERFWLFALFASLAILTKESAIVLPLVVLTYSVLQWLLLGVRPAAVSLRGLVSIVMPYAVFGLFLLIQKQQNGWYFFPYHMEILSFHFVQMTEQLAHYRHFLLWEQGRWTISLLIIMGSLAAIFRGALLNRRIVLNIIPLFAIAFVAFVCFNALFAVYMDRYVLCALVLLSVAAGVSLSMMVSRLWVVTMVIMALLTISVKYYDTNEFHYDSDMSFRHQINVTQLAVDFAIDQSKHGIKVTGNFPVYYALCYPEAGYLFKGKVDTATSVGDSGYYFLYCDPGAYSDLGDSKTLIRTFHDGCCQVHVYWLGKP